MKAFINNSSILVMVELLMLGYVEQAEFMVEGLLKRGVN